MMKIILIRHGEDPQGQRGGWSDSQLTQTGVAEVKLAAHKLKEHDFDLIISSDLNRAKMTRRLLVKNVAKELYMIRICVKLIMVYLQEWIIV